MVAGAKDLPGQLKMEYDKHKDCMEKYLHSVRELKIEILGKMQIFDAEIVSFKAEIQVFEAKIKDLDGKK